MRFPLRSIYHCLSASKPAQMEFFTTNTTAGTAGAAINRRHRRREKVVVIMGPTGSGKSRLSVAIATRFNGEIINSDKIQVYKGLDITTNKIPVDEQLGVPHHLLGEFDSANGEFTPAEFRSRVTPLITGITSRRKVPVVAGGSNSFIYALLSDRFDPDSDSDVFSGPDSVSPELRYNCCFLYIDVSLPVLNKYLGKRVDEMIDSGMVEELAEFYDSAAIHDSEPNTGVRKAIGVPEFETYFLKNQNGDDDRVREGVYEEAVRAIKDNTCQLAKRQLEKIQRLRNGGWDLHKLDGTDSFRAVLDGSKSWSDVWERQVVAPSVKIVKRFLEEE